MRWLIVALLLLPLAAAQNLDVDVFREVAPGVRDFGTITARPGETVVVFIEAENRNPDRNDASQRIDNIFITATVEDVLDGEDLEEEFDEFDLNPRRKEIIELSIPIPLRVDTEDFVLELKVEGEEGEEEFFFSEEFTIHIEKQRYEIRVETFGLATQPQCGEPVDVALGLLNLGFNDQDVAFSIGSTNLGYAVERQVRLEAFPGVDRYQGSFPVLIPQDVQGSQQLLLEVVYGDGTLRLTKQAALDVACDEEESQAVLQEQGSQTRQETQTPSPTTAAVVRPVDTTTPVPATSVRSGPNVGLIVLGVVLFLLIAALVVLFVLIN